ncbi:1-acylglycerol-3-phosphate acyltransferase [Metarhizium album ARSEF 1941]|uniref:1-acylglycerol-3-phosphate acyltransferase n=1 Tax=Metarhizium album (strain ARSEF 1941) TaxID=1081103 RepID=A0A0B2WR48_METAS|nr:1-acylglycerol-3-phosphate acyltransferase [Metarhizium album ARSEF 1941]KHN98536.1 1-acylglycerol-3-phosphate acyltransferase [Metarhizium album ARSEF 1941]
MSQHSSPWTHLRGLIITVPWLLYLLLVDISVSMLLPLAIFAPRWVYHASSYLAFTVWAWIQFVFEALNGAHVEISGDFLPSAESAIVVANHVAWSDFYLIQAVARRSGMLGYCRYFAKSQLKFVPFLGWGLWAMGMPMVSRNWLKDEAELDRVFSGLVSHSFPTWLISFSEATRFTKKKLAESQVWCKKNDRPQPRHLLYPRTKGFISTIRHLRKAPHVKAVYDLTIAYQCGGVFHEAPRMWDTLSVPDLSTKHRFRFHIHVRRFPLETLPESDQGLAQWLEQRWAEKGEWLESLKQAWSATGSS